MQQLRLEVADYQACCKKLGDDLAAKDRELQGQLPSMFNSSTVFCFLLGKAFFLMTLIVVRLCSTYVALTQWHNHAVLIRKKQRCQSTALLRDGLARPCAPSLVYTFISLLSLN